MLRICEDVSYFSSQLKTNYKALVAISGQAEIALRACALTRLADQLKNTFKQHLKKAIFFMVLSKFLLIKIGKEISAILIFCHIMQVNQSGWERKYPFGLWTKAILRTPSTYHLLPIIFLWLFTKTHLIGPSRHEIRALPFLRERLVLSRILILRENLIMQVRFSHYLLMLGSFGISS